MVAKYRVIISGRARKSLDRIVEYITQSSSRLAATKVEKGLLESALNLKSLPNRHPVAHRAKSGEIFRYISKWSYKIIFTVLEDDSDVVVIEIFHSSQDPQKLVDILPT